MHGRRRRRHHELESRLVMVLLRAGSAIQHGQVGLVRQVRRPGVRRRHDSGRHMLKADCVALLMVHRAHLVMVTWRRQTQPARNTRVQRVMVASRCHVRMFVVGPAQLVAGRTGNRMMMLVVVVAMAVGSGGARCCREQ